MPPIQDHVSIPAQSPSLLKVYGRRKDFSWGAELRHIFSHKFFNIIWWPLFQYKQRHFTRSTLFGFCKTLPGFTNLWNGIQKGAFAYNSLFLRIKPFHRLSSFTDLADITTLALFFGDEFIDGVCVTAGKSRIRELLNNNPERFCLTKEIRSGQIQLEYRFDLTTILPSEVLKEINPKYGIRYNKFYDLLQQFLQLINDRLNEFPLRKAQVIADKVIDLCNTCFNSYLHDVNTDPVGENIENVAAILHSHELKTRYMQKKLLELRCILVDKESMMNSSQTQGWLDIMRVVQIYDDMQDVFEDDGFQDNLVLSTAYHYFPGEWEWLSSNKNLLANSNEKALWLSIHMPASIEYCLQLAADKIRIMNWEQQKITHYLLFKNWFVPCKKSARDPINLNENDILLEIYQDVKDKMSHVSSQAIKSYSIEACFHSAMAKKQLLNKVDLTTAYQLRYNLLLMTTEAKATIFDRVI